MANKKTKAFAKAPLGSGKRFSACMKKMLKKYDDPEVARKVCASIGRKAYGKKKFQQLAIKARKRKNK